MKQLKAVETALRSRPGDPELELRHCQLLVATDIAETRALPEALKDLLPRHRVQELNRGLDEAEKLMCQGSPWQANAKLGKVVQLIQLYLDEESRGRH